MADDAKMKIFCDRSSKAIKRKPIDTESLNVLSTYLKKISESLLIKY